MHKIKSIFKKIIKNLIYSIPLSLIFFLSFYFFYNFYFKKDINIEQNFILSLKVFPVNSYSISKIKNINLELKDLYKKNNEMSEGYDYLLKSSQEDNLNLFKHYLIKSISTSYPDIRFQLFEERNNIPFYDKKNFKINIHTNQNDFLDKKNTLIELLINTKSALDDFLEINKIKKKLEKSFLRISKNKNNQINTIKTNISRLENNLILINDLLIKNTSSENSCNDLQIDEILHFIRLYENLFYIDEESLGNCYLYLRVIKEKTLQLLNSFQSQYLSIQHLDRDLEQSDEEVFLGLLDKFHDNFNYVEYDTDSINFKEVKNNKEFNFLEYLVIYFLLFILSNFLVLYLKKIRNDFL